MKILITWCRKFCLRFFLSAGFVLLWLAALPQSTHACSPSDPYRPATFAEKTWAAELVLEVSLIEDVPDVLPFNDTATFTVHSWLKGAGPSTVTVGGFGPGPQCLDEVPQRRAILFARGDPLAGPLNLEYRGTDGPVVHSSPEALYKIAAAVHMQSQMMKGVAIGLPVIFAIVTVILWLRRRAIHKGTLNHE